MMQLLVITHGNFTTHYYGGLALILGFSAATWGWRRTQTNPCRQTLRVFLEIDIVGLECAEAIFLGTAYRYCEEEGFDLDCPVYLVGAITIASQVLIAGGFILYHRKKTEQLSHSLATKLLMAYAIISTTGILFNASAGVEAVAYLIYAFELAGIVYVIQAWLTSQQMLMVMVKYLVVFDEVGYIMLFYKAIQKAREDGMRGIYCLEVALQLAVMVQCAVMIQATHLHEILKPVKVDSTLELAVRDSSGEHAQLIPSSAPYLLAANGTTRNFYLGSDEKLCALDTRKMAMDVFNHWRAGTAVLDRPRDSFKPDNKIPRFMVQHMVALFALRLLGYPFTMANLVTSYIDGVFWYTDFNNKWQTPISYTMNCNPMRGLAVKIHGACALLYCVLFMIQPALGFWRASSPWIRRAHKWVGYLVFVNMAFLLLPIYMATMAMPVHLNGNTAPSGLIMMVGAYFNMVLAVKYAKAGEMVDHLLAVIMLSWTVDLGTYYRFLVNVLPAGSCTNRLYFTLSAVPYVCATVHLWFVAETPVHKFLAWLNLPIAALALITVLPWLLACEDEQAFYAPNNVTVALNNQTHQLLQELSNCPFN
eukprot:TRINITY_DN54908_c0_g1_i1.p1 TRINITY_DN54908_c0_g1~~TRINITY_DN54908_c0_g1_i1.p1  ORF type:complete len:591 (-),score=97.30 TRINITY_DN54908_c0_g1_i1:210-1982(-)